MADVELLPLHSGNVAHLIAAQAAEIEALRAEVERLSALLGQTEHSLADIANAQYLRAERLAEALREAQPFIGRTGSYPELHAKIDALLRGQEEDHEQ